MVGNNVESIDSPPSLLESWVGKLGLLDKYSHVLYGGSPKDWTLTLVKVVHGESIVGQTIVPLLVQISVATTQ